MAAFHVKHGSGVKLRYQDRTAELDKCNALDTVVFSSCPLIEGSDTFEFRVEKVSWERFLPTIGVTTTDPFSLPEVPQCVWDVPEALVMDGGRLYATGRELRSDPDSFNDKLEARNYDRVGVFRVSKGVSIYINDIQKEFIPYPEPDPLWVLLQMFIIEKISVIPTEVKKSKKMKSTEFHFPAPTSQDKAADGSNTALPVEGTRSLEASPSGVDRRPPNPANDTPGSTKLDNISQPSVDKHEVNVDVGERTPASPPMFTTATDDRHNFADAEHIPVEDRRDPVQGDQPAAVHGTLPNAEVGPPSTGADGGSFQEGGAGAGKVKAKQQTRNTVTEKKFQAPPIATPVKTDEKSTDAPPVSPQKASDTFERMPPEGSFRALDVDNDTPGSTVDNTSMPPVEEDEAPMEVDEEKLQTPGSSEAEPLEGLPSAGPLGTSDTGNDTPGDTGGSDTSPLHHAEEDESAMDTDEGNPKTPANSPVVAIATENAEHVTDVELASANPVDALPVQGECQPMAANCSLSNLEVNQPSTGADRDTIQPSGAGAEEDGVGKSPPTDLAQQSDVEEPAPSYVEERKTGQNDSETPTYEGSISHI